MHGKLLALQRQSDNGRLSECSQADIYSNSIITIAADFSDDVYGGSDSLYPAKLPRLNLDTWLARWPKRPGSWIWQERDYLSDSLPPVYLCRRGTVDFKTKAARPCVHESNRRVLEDRAWCVQERALSRRIIHLCEAEIYWECRNKTNPICSCGFEASTGVGDSVVGPCSFNERPEVSPRKKWQKIVAAYSRGGLTFPTDRLPAISGLARRFPMQDFPYIAGMWFSDSMSQDLGWYNTHGFGTDTANQEPALEAAERKHLYDRLPEDYAPTWSWASSTAPVSFDYQLNDRVLDWCIRDVIYNHASPDNFGPVTYARLILDSYILPVLYIDGTSVRIFSDEYLGRYFISWDIGAEGEEWVHSYHGIKFMIVVACWDLLNLTGMIVRRKTVDASAKKAGEDVWKRCGMVWLQHGGPNPVSDFYKNWKMANSKFVITVV